MDLDKAIRELYEERRLLDQVIASLEALSDTEQRDIPSTAPPAKRRGRKAMSAEERQLVSQRMKDYWANKKTPHRSSDASGNGENPR